MSDDLIDKAEKKIEEFSQKRFFLNQCWKRLIQEGLRIAKERGLDLVVSESPFTIQGSNQAPVVVEDTEQNELIELAKQSVPRLYNIYQRDLKEYKEMASDLQKIYDSINEQHQ